MDRWFHQLALRASVGGGFLATLVGSYVVSGEIKADGKIYQAGVMLVAHAGKGLELRAHGDSRVTFIGGELHGERIVWWNFVPSSPERLEKAKDDWREGRFGSVPVYASARWCCRRRRYRHLPYRLRRPSTLVM